MSNPKKWLIDTVNPALAVSVKEAMFNSMTANDIYQAMSRRIEVLCNKHEYLGQEELIILLEARDAYEEAAEDAAEEAETRP